MDCTIYDYRFYDRTKTVADIVEIKDFFGKKLQKNKIQFYQFM